MTAIAPVIGYDRAAELFKKAAARGVGIRQILEDEKVLPREEIDRLLDLRKLATGPCRRRPMSRLAVLLGALLASGCFVSLNAPFFGGARPLAEETVEGEGRAKVLLVDVSEVITDMPSKRAFGLVEEESTLERITSDCAGPRTIRA